MERATCITRYTVTRPPGFVRRSGPADRRLGIRCPNRIQGSCVAGHCIMVYIVPLFLPVHPVYYSFFVSCFPSRPQRRGVSEMEKAVFPLRKCTVFIFRKNRLRLPLWGSWGRAAPESCGRRLETGGAFLASFFRRRKKEGYKADAVCPKRRNLQPASGFQIKILNPSGSQKRLLHSPEASSFQTRHKKSQQKE